MRDFVEAYEEALLWSSVVFDHNGEDQHADDFEPSAELKAQMREDCEQFLDAAKGALMLLPDDYTMTQAGHDFALTRNGHGAGFFDRDLGDLGDRLTQYAEQMGETDLYLGDDGLLYSD